MQSRARLGPVVTSLVLVACGSSGGGGPHLIDATDGSGGGSGSGSGSGGCPIDAGFTLMGGANVVGGYQADGTDATKNDYFAYERTSAADDADDIDLELWPAAQFATGYAPATYTIGANAADSDYNACGLCAVAYDSTDPSAPAYIATSGTVQLAMASTTTLAATYTNVHLKHITFDSDGNQQDAADSCVVDVPAWTFSVTPENLDAAGSGSSPFSGRTFAKRAPHRPRAVLAP